MRNEECRRAFFTVTPVNPVTKVIPASGGPF
jgi:hypothetical protein